MCLNPQFLYCLISEGSILQSCSRSLNIVLKCVYAFEKELLFIKNHSGKLNVKSSQAQLKSKGWRMSVSKMVKLQNSIYICCRWKQKNNAVQNYGLWCYFYCLQPAWLFLPTSPDPSPPVCDSPSQSALAAPSCRLHPDIFHFPVIGLAVSCN